MVAVPRAVTPVTAFMQATREMGEFREDGSCDIFQGYVMVRSRLSQRFLAEAVDSGGKNITTMLEFIRLDAFLQVIRPILQSIVKKQGEYATYDPSLIKAAQKGLEVFNKYYLAMKSNDMYWIASILDPWIKANWLKKNHPDA
ncbi:hypothetical protein G7Y89_g15331 [Cudoniella acicularis]|uniref:Uncharacterized protein n=1 Tax=Cudoniella acicularis TaxID=354080 RepID=A0A8H4QQ78_9HELO|nr:hypothetical protein G7Y89_g15331 [Cudoniella acicularis]